jgi:hypothetical protein
LKVEVRLATEKDAEKFVEWEAVTTDNLWDPTIAGYPNLRTLAVDIDGEPAVYVPFHPVFVVESLGHKPGITPRENAYALRKVQNALEDLARQYGIAECWWMCADASLMEFVKRHGYEVVQTHVLRKKVSPNA